MAFLGGPLHFLSELKAAFIRTLNLDDEHAITPENSHLFAAIGSALNYKEDVETFVKTERKKQEDGNICVELPVNENGVVYFELNAGKVNPDRGYDYDRVVSLKA